jgi:two-component sensor histidine kinase
MSEGFALCAGDWDGDRLVGYRVLEMNPALLGMLGVGREVLGKPAVLTGPRVDRWLTLCQEVLTTGTPARFAEYEIVPWRWFDMHVVRVGENRMGQFFFDVTARKRARDAQSHLFDELNHRTKNNLALVSAMLRLQAGEGGQSSDALVQAAQRVETIAGMHETLYQGTQRGSVALDRYLEKLVEQMSRSFGGSDSVTLSLSCAPAAPALERAVPLGLIVNELVTNAVKYAYPGDTRGAVRIAFSAQEGGWRLVVADDGVGAQGGEGFGRRLVASLVRQLGGKMRVLTDAGTRTEVDLPADFAEAA